MVIVVANSLPNRIRGRMKLWFIEPRANTFVSGITDHVAMKVTDYLLENCPKESGVIIFRSTTKTPGYQIHTLGITDKKILRKSGLQLVIEKE